MNKKEGHVFLFNHFSLNKEHFHGHSPSVLSPKGSNREKQRAKPISY